MMRSLQSTPATKHSCRCIPAFTPSYITPCSNTYPHPGHVSLGTASPLLLQSSRLSPVDLSSLLSSLDIYVRPLCSYFKVPTRSPSALLPHLDMMFQIFLKHHFHRRFGPLCGICFSFLQRILTHQNFVGVRHLARGRHLIMSSTRLCLFHKDFCTLSVLFDTFLTSAKDSLYGYKRTAPLIFVPMFFFRSAI